MIKEENYKLNSLEQMIKEIKISLQNKCYFSALALSLLIPDICGEIEYPELKNNDGKRLIGKQYARWFDTWYKCPNKTNDNISVMSPLNGDLCYKLRCAFLHSGTDDIGKKKFHLNDFKLIFSNYNELGGGHITVYNSEDNTTSYGIDIVGFCNVMIWVLTVYLKSNSTKQMPFLNITYSKTYK